MRGGGSPARAAQVLSLLLYSPGSHEEHIKCSSARAELATNITKPHRATGQVRLLRGAGDAVGGFGGFGSVYDGGFQGPYGEHAQQV